MSVNRFGGVKLHGGMQPAWARTTTAFAGTTTAVADKLRLQPAIHKTAAVSYEAASLIAALLTPASVVALVLGLWRLGADLGWTEDFVIANGLFSHWQVWFALALGLKATGSLIHRPVVSKDPEQPV